MSKQLPFVRNVVQDYQPAGYIKWKDIVGAAVYMCDALLNGATVDQVAGAMYKSGRAVQHDSALLVEGTHFFCPSQVDKVKQWIGFGNSGGSGNGAGG
jgi:hypothetical protein